MHCPPCPCGYLGALWIAGRVRGSWKIKKMFDSLKREVTRITCIYQQS
jgi:hypothetical protein